MAKPTVWRLVWEQGGLTFRSDWSIHYDVVREYKSQLARDAPGVSAEMQAATVSEVEDVTRKDFPDDPNNFVGSKDSPATIGGVDE